MKKTSCFQDILSSRITRRKMLGKASLFVGASALTGCGTKNTSQAEKTQTDEADQITADQTLAFNELRRNDRKGARKNRVLA